MIIAKSTRRRRWAIRIGVAVLLLVLAVVGVFAFWGPSFIAHGIAVAPNAGRTFQSSDDPTPAQIHDLGIDEQLRVEVVGTCRRPLSLSVWIIEPKAEPLGTVFVLHGIRSDKFWLRGLAAQVAAQGYRAILPDLPGHGRSSGDWLTYGACEASEMKALLDELTKQGRVSGNVGVVGLSYGAAVAVQLAAVDPRVRAAVAIAPFSSLRQVVPEYVSHYLPLLGQLVPASFVQHAVDQAGALGSFDPDSASPLVAVTRTQAQILFVHGQADRHIPATQSSALHAAAPTHTQLMLVEGDDHFSIATDRTRAIETHGMPWLHRWLDAPTPAAASVSSEPDVALVEAIRSIGRDIAALKPRYPQLSSFDAEQNVSPESLSISYQYKTHRSTISGGWSAHVPNPDPDGVWLYIDFHDANSRSQIHTQPFTGNFTFRNKKVSFLMLEGEKTKHLHSVIWSILNKHGVVSAPLSPAGSARPPPSRN